MNIFINRVKQQVDTEFFNEFNWENFTPGDVVWMEDWQGFANCAVFVSVSPAELHLVEVTRFVANEIESMS